MRAHHGSVEAGPALRPGNGFDLDDGSPPLGIQGHRASRFGELPACPSAVCLTVQLHGVFMLRIEAAQPESVVRGALSEPVSRPQFLATDRHVTQGALELETVEWDAPATTIRGVSLGVLGTDHNLYLYLPEKHPWRQREPFFYTDFAGYTLQVTEPQILRLHLRFDRTERVSWEVNLKQLFSS